MQTDNSKIYNSSVVQSDLLYKYFLLSMLNLSIKSEQQSRQTGKELPCPRYHVEIITLPKQQYLEIISQPKPSLPDLVSWWTKFQNQKVRSLTEINHIHSLGFINWADQDSDTMLSELAQSILDKTEKISPCQGFIKVLFPSEGMFENYTESNRVYLRCKVAVMVTSKYFNLSK
jgi:hypothetical protein